MDDSEDPFEKREQESANDEAVTAPETKEGAFSQPPEWDPLWEQDQWVAESRHLLELDGLCGGLEQGHTDDAIGGIREKAVLPAEARVAQELLASSTYEGEPTGEYTDDRGGAEDLSQERLKALIRRKGSDSNVRIRKYAWDESDFDGPGAPLVEEQLSNTKAQFQGHTAEGGNGGPAHLDTRRLAEQLQLRARAEAEDRYAWLKRKHPGLEGRMGRGGQRGVTTEKWKCRWKGAEVGYPQAAFQGPTIEELVEEVDKRQSDNEGGKAQAESERAADQPSQGDKRKKRGGRRRGASSMMELWCVNSSGKPQLEQTITAATEIRKKGTQVVALLNQEHQQGKDKLPDLQYWAKGQGWALTAASAIRTERGGDSAGVAIVTPRDVPAGLAPGCKADLAIDGSKGRAVMTWIQQIAPGGATCASVYMWHSEGGTSRNFELLQRTLKAVRAVGCPWIVGLDANDTPEGLARWAGPLLTKAGGRIISIGEPTHFPAEGGGEARNIDFFILSTDLAKMLHGVRRVDEVSTSPHRVVALQFCKTRDKLLQWTLRAPKAFPRNKPTGCARAPHAPPREDVERWEKAKTEEERQVGLAGAWGEVIQAAEVELCGVTDKFSKDGPDPRFCGRGDGPRYVQAQTLPPRIAGRYGEADSVMHSLLWARNRLAELGHLADKAAGTGAHEPTGADSEGRHTFGGRLAVGQWRQWDRLVGKYVAAGSPVCRILSKDSQWARSVETMRAYRHRPWAAGEFLYATHEWAELIIQDKNQAHVKSRRKGWEMWVAKQLKQGAGGLHEWVKRTTTPPEEVIQVRGAPTAAPCDIVEADFKAWQGIWSKLERWGSAPWRTEAARKLCEEAEKLPDFGAKELRKACRSFAAHTGWGIDNVGPRQLSWLSDELLETFATLLKSMECVGIWPSQLQEALIHLIPKPTGGRRPIGLVAALPRVWERVRKPVLLRWRQRYSREYNWMTQGKGAERAVWAQSVEEEAARFDGRKSTAVLVDLVKAFEQVTLVSVWGAGIRAGFHPDMLRLGMELCLFRRRLVYRRAMSETTVSTQTAILAGLGIATDLMFLKLVKPLDQLQSEFICLRMFLIADDLRLGVQHQDEEVLIRTTDKVTKRAIELMEHEQHMEISRGQGGKTVALASNTKVRRGIGKRLKRSGIGVEKNTRNLGVDCALHKGGRKMTIQQGRLVKVKAKEGRLRRIGGRAGLQVGVTAFSASVTYGTTTTGMTDGMLAALRTMIARSRGKLAGRSTSARLLMEGVDLGRRVIVDPVRRWVEAWWDGLVDRDIMRKAWRHAIVTVGMAARPNSKVQGGAGALFASLRRLGWTMPSPEAVKTRGGVTLYYGSEQVPEGAHMVDPKSMRRWLDEAHEIETARTSEVAKDISVVGAGRGYGREKEGGGGEGQGTFYGDEEGERKKASVWRRARYEYIEEQLVPWFWPLRRVFKAAVRKGRIASAASFRACVEGAWWTATRLHMIGVKAHNKCRCGCAAGTLWHKLARCSRTAEERDGNCPTELLEMGRARVWDPMFARGVPARPKVPRPPKARVWFEKLKEEAEFLADGVIYTDGSAQGRHRLATRAGYGAVCYHIDGTPRWVMRGICGEPHASIVRAELQAVLQVIRVATDPVTIMVDNAFVVQGFREGKEWCTRSGTEAADIWREIWPIMEDRGELITVQKVKAHTSWADVVEGRVSHMNHVGNAAADKAAKEALRVAKSEAPTDAFNSALAAAMLWSRWIIDYATTWDSLHQEEQEEGDAAAEREREEQRAQEQVKHRGSLAHELWKGRGRTECRRCGRMDGPEHPVASFGSDACKGVAAGRVRAAATGNKNFIWATYKSTVTEMGAKGLVKALTVGVPRELIDEERLGEVGLEEEQGRRQGGGHENRGGGQAGSRGAHEEEARQAGTHVRAVARQHALRTRGLIAWCDVCGSYSVQRAGGRLKGECHGATNRHRLTRLSRLRSGRHPITGQLI